MSKELFISSSPHETKVAVFEDDELVEVYHERDTGAGLVGGIYKGRVSRVLPGMQSAFVDIGLERDAFLYVSDFFEDSEEYDKVVSEAEARVSRISGGGGGVLTGLGTTAAPPPAQPSTSAIPAISASHREMVEAAGVAEPARVASADAEPAAKQDETLTASTAPPAFPEPSAAIAFSGEHEPVDRAPVAEAILPPGNGSADQETAAGAASVTPIAEVPPASPNPRESAPSQGTGAPRPFGRPGGPPRDSGADGDHDNRGRRRRRRGRGFRERRFEPRPEVHDRPPQYSAPQSFEVLPGESLAKHAPSAHGEPSPAAVVGSGVASGPVELAEPAEPVYPDFTPTDIAPAAQERASDVHAGEIQREPLPGAVDFAAASASLEPDPLVDSRFESPSAVLAPEPQAAAAGMETAPHPAASVENVVQPEQLADEASAAGGLATPWPAENFEPQGGDDANQAPDEPALEASAVTEASFATEFSAEASFNTGSAGAVSDLAPTEAAQPVPADAAAEEINGSSAPETPAAPAVGQPEQAAGSGERSYTLREPSHRRPHFAPRRGRRGRRAPGDRDRDRDRSRPRGGPTYASESRPGNNQPVQISELLKEGQEILVQIAKEPLGNKGARITSHIALPGRYLVYMPTIHHIGVSRKIGSEEERLRLRNIILENRGALTGGFIVRTAGAGRSEEEFKADLRFLSALWSEIRSKAERTRAPALLHRDLDLVQRILRDMLSPDFKSVRADNEVEYERVLDFVSRCQPSLVGHVKLWNRDVPLFEEFGIQAEIDKALKPKIWLKSGGFIVINQTEALVAIDVNTGKYVGKTNRLEDTIVKTNIDAVKEIVRQIRLRDLGGIIVIDFIDMDERRNRQKVVQALEEALRLDRAPTNILSINEFGLVALTRKRVKQSLERTLCEPCPYCTAAGWIKSASTVCFEILAEARKMASQLEGKTLTLRINPEVARVLKSRDGTLLSELEAITGKDVIVKSDTSVHQERFEIF